MFQNEIKHVYIYYRKLLHLIFIEGFYFFSELHGKNMPLFVSSTKSLHAVSCLPQLIVHKLLRNS